MIKNIFIFFIFALTIISSIYGNDALTVTENRDKIIPSEVHFQPQYYPVFIIDMPDGYTDFELKGSVTNFIGTGSDPDNSHDGTELIFYYHSNAPYVSTSGGRAPLQKFNIDLTHIYFTVSTASKYTNDSKNGWITVNGTEWDGRRYIYQLKSTTALTNNNYAISSYVSSNGKVGSIMVIIGWDKNSSNTYDKTMEQNCNPTNYNMIWTVLFQNDATSERDGNNNPIWRVISPVYWISDCDASIWKSNLSN